MTELAERKRHQGKRTKTELSMLMRNIYTEERERASLVAQMVKNPPAMRETWVRSLGWKDPLEKGKATHSSILAWKILWTV